MEEGKSEPIRPKFLMRIIDAELCDFLEDIEMVERRHSERYESLKISQYVYLENTALLEMERECLKLIIGRIREWDAEAYADCASLGDAVIGEARDFVRRFEYPESVVAIVQRKVDKIMRYLCGPEL